MQKRFYFFIVLAILMIATQMLWPFSMESLEYFSQYISLLLPAVLFVIVTKSSFKEVFKLRAINLKSFLLTVAGFFALQPVMAFVASINNSLHISFFGEKSLESAMSFGGGLGLLASLFVTAVTPAICEEAVMRGVMLPSRFKTSIHKMALLNGILFGIFHFNFPQLAYPIVLGMIVTYFVVITKSIIPAVLIHFLNNGVSVFAEKFQVINQLFFGYERGPSFIANNSFLMFGYQLLLAGIACFILFIIIKKLMIINNYSASSHEIVEAQEDESKYPRLVKAFPVVIIAVLYFQLVFNNSPY